MKNQTLYIDRFSSVSSLVVTSELQTGRETDGQVRDRVVRDSESQHLRSHAAHSPITYQRTLSSNSPIVWQLDVHPARGIIAGVGFWWVVAWIGLHGRLGAEGLRVHFEPRSMLPAKVERNDVSGSCKLYHRQQHCSARQSFSIRRLWRSQSGGYAASCGDR